MTAASAIIAAQAAKPTPAFKKSSRLACSAVSLKVAIIKTVRDTMGIQASAKLRFLSD